MVELPSESLIDDTRLNFHEYFMLIASMVSLRSTCHRRKVGCVIVKDNFIVSTGYNGSVTSTTHCTKNSCYRIQNNIPSGTELDMCYAVHAEQNAITQAAMESRSIKNATAYITTTPCITCLKLLAQCGIKNIYCYKGDYPQTTIAKNIIQECGITINTDYYKQRNFDISEFLKTYVNQFEIFKL